MVNSKDAKYYALKMIEDIEYIIENTKNISLEEFNTNQLLNYAICFKMIQLSENAKKLEELVDTNKFIIPWRQIVGLRNRIVHDYGGINFTIIYNSIKNDLPILDIELRKI